MIPHLVKNYDGTYSPRDPWSDEWSIKNKTGSAYAVKDTSTRNYPHTQKYFVMIRMAFDNLPEVYNEKYPTELSLRKALQVAAGYFDIIYYLDGGFAKVSQSISFASMSQEEFEKLYSAVLDVILKHFGFGREFEEELILQFG